MNSFMVVLLLSAVILLLSAKSVSAQGPGGACTPGDGNKTACMMLDITGGSNAQGSCGYDQVARGTPSTTHCVPCGSRNMTSCEDLGTFTGLTTPCRFNHGGGVCMSFGYPCSEYTSQSLCDSPFGYFNLTHCTWSGSQCQGCGQFTRGTCPPLRCTIDKSSTCAAPAPICDSMGSNQSKCEDPNLPCYFDAGQSKCIWCGLLMTQSDCQTVKRCEWSTAESFCGTHAATPTPAASSTSLALGLGVGLGVGGVVLIVVVSVLVWFFCFRKPPTSQLDASDGQNNSVNMTEQARLHPLTGPPTLRDSNIILSVNSQGSTMPKNVAMQNADDFAGAPINAESVPVWFRNGYVQRQVLLGRGANGSVYSCFLPNGSTIAMKEVLLPPSHLADDVVESVMKEVNIVSSLDHPNVVKFYGSVIDRSEHRLIIFMEIISGGSLGSRARSMKEHMNEATARLYAKQIVTALAYVHSMGVVHRDMKCDNLLLTNGGIIKLTDFGASKVVGMGAMATQNAQTMVGTPFFMAPEVLLTGDDGTSGYGKRADVWSLGITLLEMMNCGNPPWPPFPSTGAAFMHIASEGSLPVIPDFLSEEAKDFIKLCCCRNAAERSTSEALLSHPWIKDVPLPNFA